jgi:hypothetical protein
MDADALAIEKLRGRAQRFGVLAPDAFQRTALKEHQRPDSRAVVYGEALNIGDYGGKHV